jgi:hypothetical protein
LVNNKKALGFLAPGALLSGGSVGIGLALAAGGRNMKGRGPTRIFLVPPIERSSLTVATAAQIDGRRETEIQRLVPASQRANVHAVALGHTPIWKESWFWAAHSNLAS